MTDRTGHWVRPTIDAGMGVSLKITCHEPEGAECRKVVDNSVDPSLLSSPGGWEAFARPLVYKDSGYCQWADFYASTGDEAAFYGGEDDQTIAEAEVVIWYEDARDYDDGGAFYWRYIS